MKSILTRTILIPFLLILFIPNLTFAETKIFIKEYTYQAGDEDSKNSCRVISLREVKRLLLEELGTYLESVTEVQNFKLTKDRIIILTAGIVQTELLAEKWDTETMRYWLKARVKADSSDVIKAIDMLRKDRQKTKELEEATKRSEKLLKENERLRKELTTAKGEKQKKAAAVYNTTIKNLSASEWYEKGYAAFVAGNNAEAIAAVNEAVNLNPQYAEAYYYRGTIYYYMDNYYQAIKDFNKAIDLNPQYAEAYHYRGFAYFMLGNYDQSGKNYQKAIELNPKLKD